MNRIDFASRDGGMAFDGEVMEFLQSAHADILNLLYADAPANIPVIISGMVKTIVGSSYNMSAGLFYYNGELVKFPAQSVTMSLSDPVHIALNTASENAIFYDDGNLTPVPVIHTREGELVVGYTGGIDLSPGSFITWAQIFGAKAKTPPALAGGTFSTAGPDIEMDLQYSKNLLPNTLHIYGNISIIDTQSMPTERMSAGTVTLPVGFRPQGGGQPDEFPVFIGQQTAGAIMKDTAGNPLKDIRASISTTGLLSFEFVKPAVAITSYGGTFNVIIPLD
jgi:hypothetical protein